MQRGPVQFRGKYFYRYYSDVRMKPVHEAMQRFDYFAALDLLNGQLVSLKHTRDWLFAAALCMRKLRLYDRAVVLLENQLHTDDEYDLYVALELIHCYQKIGRDDLAQDLYHSIPQNILNDAVHVVMTKFYLHLKQFSNAQQHINEIDTRSASLFQFERANWFAKKGMFGRAQDALLDDADMRQPRSRLLLAKVVGKQGNREEQKKILDKDTDHADDAFNAKLQQARRHEKLLEFARAMTIYYDLLNKYPACYGKILPRLCRHYVESNHPYSLNFLDASIEAFPFLQSLYLLKARYFELQENDRAMVSALFETKKCFPYTPKTYEKLLRHFEKTENFIELAKLASEAICMFGGAEFLPDTIKQQLSQVRLPVPFTPEPSRVIEPSSQERGVSSARFFGEVNREFLGEPLGGMHSRIRRAKKMARESKMMQAHLLEQVQGEPPAEGLMAKSCAPKM